MRTWLVGAPRGKLALVRGTFFGIGMAVFAFFSSSGSDEGVARFIGPVVVGAVAGVVFGLFTRRIVDLNTTDTDQVVP